MTTLEEKADALLARLTADMPAFREAERTYVRADEVTPDHILITRNDRGKKVGEHPVKEVNRRPAGCWYHVHITLTDRRQQCYEPATLLEVA